MTDGDLEQAIVNACNGDEQAAQEIWDQYFERLLRYARRKLHGLPRRALDEEDVVVSAMESFFALAANQELRFRGRDDLWKLLATITVRKATAQLRRHYAQKRGGGLVRGESAFVDARGEPIANGIQQILDDRNLDEMSDYLCATCEERLSRLNDPSLREVAVLKLQGCTNDEIAERLGCSRPTINRKLARIREKWSGEDREDRLQE